MEFTFNSHYTFRFNREDLPQLRLKLKKILNDQVSFFDETNPDFLMYHGRRLRDAEDAYATDSWRFSFFSPEGELMKMDKHICQTTVEVIAFNTSKNCLEKFEIGVVEAVEILRSIHLEEA